MSLLRCVRHGGPQPVRLDAVQVPSLLPPLPATLRTFQMHLILHRVEQQVGRVSLNRPDVLNSFNRAMALELQQVLLTIENDPEVRAVLLTGEGRAFCAGQDLSDVTGKLGPIVQESYNPIIRAIRRLRKPVVCSVGGVAAGAGANLALACDIVFVSENASLP